MRRFRLNQYFDVVLLIVIQGCIIVGYIDPIYDFTFWIEII